MTDRMFKGQFIGFSDKNGVNICEGDFVRITGYFYTDFEAKSTKIFDEAGEVYYNAENAGFWVKFFTGCHTPIFFSLITLHDKQFEIIKKKGF